MLASALLGHAFGAVAHLTPPPKLAANPAARLTSAPVDHFIMQNRF